MLCSGGSMLETNKIHLGDCLDLMKEIPDKSIDLVLTDPPYGINIGNSTGKGVNRLVKIGGGDCVPQNLQGV